MNNYNNSNNASTTISAGISASATTLLVDNGAILPNAPFLLTLEHIDNEKVTVREIVKCTAKIGNALTIVRSAGTCVQDDTATPKVQSNTPHSFGVGDFASIYWTSEQVKDIQDEINQKLNITDFQAGTYVYSSSSTETDAYSITIPGTITSYQLGQVFRFMADVENTGNATLNVNGIGAIEILKNHDKHLESGDIEAGQIVEVAFDGTNFQMNSQIAQVVLLEDIDSLNYKDTTCYAGEEIHSNDLIVTNGNSFNPDRTDENLSVGGSTVNKYAIGFIGNGKTTASFTIKNSVIEGFEPDAVTINIVNDDNGKPGNTVLATSSDALQQRTNPASTTSSSISGLYAFYMNTLGTNEGKISYNTTTKIMSVSGTIYNYTLDFSSFFTGVTPNIIGKTKDDKYFMFSSGNNNFWLLHLPTPTTIDGVTVQNIDASIIATGCGYPSSTLTDLCISDDGQYMFAEIKYTSSYNEKVFKIKLTTAFVVGVYDSFEDLNLESYKSHFSFINNLGINYFVYTRYAGTEPTTYATLVKFDDNYSVIGTYNTGKFAMQKIIPDYRDEKPRFYGTGAELLFGYGRDYIGIFENTITTTTSLSTVKGTKYRLTITPVVTGSVVDSIKIYDKEGEYYSECAVRDLNSWSNVSNKTPYIDSGCILARYARKVNGSDNLEKVPCGFANGDFTELETVSYCFQGAKSGFSGLDPDTLYYSDGAGGITETAGTYSVGKSVNENTLLTNIKTA